MPHWSLGKSQWNWRLVEGSSAICDTPNTKACMMSNVCWTYRERYFEHAIEQNLNKKNLERKVLLSAIIAPGYLKFIIDVCTNIRVIFWAHYNTSILLLICGTLAFKRYYLYHVICNMIGKTKKRSFTITYCHMEGIHALGYTEVNTMFDGSYNHETVN